MTSKNTYWSNFFFGFAIVTVLSGIYLIVEKHIIIGISGIFTGLFLFFFTKKNNTKG